jgi:hypothetical protein
MCCVYNVHLFIYCLTLKTIVIVCSHLWPKHLVLSIIEIKLVWHWLNFISYNTHPFTLICENYHLKHQKVNFHCTPIGRYLQEQFMVLQMANDWDSKFSFSPCKQNPILLVDTKCGSPCAEHEDRLTCVCVCCLSLALWVLFFVLFFSFFSNKMRWKHLVVGVSQSQFVGPIKLKDY